MQYAGSVEASYVDELLKPSVMSMNRTPHSPYEQLKSRWYLMISWNPSISVEDVLTNKTSIIGFYPVYRIIDRVVQRSEDEIKTTRGGRKGLWSTS